jgi:hypothetical protein
MNRWLDGKRLTADDMRDIALQAELMDPVELANHCSAIHNPNGIASFLTTLTAKERYRMFSRGELMLDTRTPTNSPGFVEP